MPSSDLEQDNDCNIIDRVFGYKQNMQITRKLSTV